MQDIEAEDAPAGAKKDPAGDDSYDNYPTAQELDDEALNRRKDERRMAFWLVVVMAVLCIAFLFSALCFVWQFHKLYNEHLNSIGHAVASQSDTGILHVPINLLAPFIVPMMPAVFCALLGLTVMTILARFITKYTTKTEEKETEIELAGNLVSLVKTIINRFGK